MNTAHTHIGFSEYFGKNHIYDGLFEAASEGTVEEVIAYLEDTKAAIPANQESLNWQGRNGRWYSGDDARQVIDDEISSLRRGSHPSQREDEE